MEDEDSILQLVYRKDGVANLDIVTLVAEDADIVCVCVCVFVCVCVCVCARAHMHALIFV